MKNYIKKLGSLIALCAVLFTLLPTPTSIPSIGGGATAYSDVPPTVRAPYPYLIEP